MVSFDVKSLFTSIPKTYTINLILDSIFSNNGTDWNGLNRNRLKKLLNWATKSTTFQFDGKFYEQLDGISMGSPIGSFMADVILNHVIDKATNLTPLIH